MILTLLEPGKSEEFLYSGSESVNFGAKTVEVIFVLVNLMPVCGFNTGPECHIKALKKRKNDASLLQACHNSKKFIYSEKNMGQNLSTNFFLNQENVAGKSKYMSKYNADEIIIKILKIGDP